MIDVYTVKIEKNMEREDFNLLLKAVSPEKRERILRFHRFEDAQRSLLGDILARYAICRRTGIRNRDIVFAANEYGKPLLAGAKETCFNIAHSGSWVACAVGGEALGIDVETVKPIDLAIARRFFTGDEYAQIVKQPEEARLGYFYRLWTLKESYIKAEGKGLSIPLNSFGFEITGEGIRLAIDGQYVRRLFRQDLLDDETVYALCTGGSPPEEIVNLTPAYLRQTVLFSESGLRA